MTTGVLRRSSNRKLIFGVIGGICERYDRTDKSVVMGIRVAFLLLCVVGYWWEILALLPLLYLGLWLVMANPITSSTDGNAGEVTAPTGGYRFGLPAVLVYSAAAPAALIGLTGLPFVPWLVSSGEMVSIWEFFDFLAITDFGPSTPLYFVALIPALLIGATPFVLQRASYVSRSQLIAVIVLFINTLCMYGIYAGVGGLLFAMSPPGGGFWPQMGPGVAFFLLALLSTVIYAVSLVKYREYLRNLVAYPDPERA